MKGVIIYNPSLKAEAVKDQIARMEEEFTLKGVEITSLPSDGFLSGVDGSLPYAALPKADFILYLNKDIPLGIALEKSGYKLFNSIKCIALCDDKALTYAALSGEVPLVDTVFAPLRYYGGDSETFLKAIKDKLGFPLVAKYNKGSMGESVFLIENENRLFEFAKQAGNIPHLFQKFYSERGVDVRAVVVGGKVVAAMKRVNEGSFKSNIECGGRGEKYDLTEEEKTICERAALKLGADYCGIDVLLGDEGCKICEVNSNAFMRGITAASGVNIARKYAEHILKNI
ncbi:MAG: RimK family alpha-L-glutamate ligase [Clostridia bacterium]|nr:RimK family alpha-L-glutamate ligase [Clostridia bacterium]